VDLSPLPPPYFTHPKKLEFARISWVVLLEAKGVQTSGPRYLPLPLVCFS